MSAALHNSRTRAHVTQIGYLGLGVSDKEDWRDFATRVLGLQDNGEGANGDLFIRMDRHHHRLILTHDGADDLVFHGWEVKDASALEAMAAQLRDFGLEVSDGTPEQAAERMVRGLIKFRDPDGMATEIYYGPLLDHTPFVSPRGVNGFVADELGFGHMVIAVSDPESYVRYLTEVLGARVSDYINIPIGPMTLNLTFLHVNARHHSIAVLAKGAIPGPPPKRLQHMMIEADSIDAVGHALDLFKARGLSTGAIGRHVNDEMLSFYGDTPSGFHIEYGFGGLLIRNEDAWNVQTWRAPSLWGHGMPTPRGARMSQAAE